MMRENKVPVSGECYSYPSDLLPFEYEGTHSQIFDTLSSKEYATRFPLVLFHVHRINVVNCPLGITSILSILL